MVGLRKDTDKKYRKSYKGAVLFTVLVVMILIIVLMLATLGLAGVASKRGYAEYNDSQTVATGRSVINSVLSSISPKGANETLGETIYEETMNRANLDNPADSTAYRITVGNGGHLGNGLGIVNYIEFSYAGMNSEKEYKDKDGNVIPHYFAKLNKDGKVAPILKVTASITMGSETTTYTEYVSDWDSRGGAGGNGGLFATGANKMATNNLTVFGPVGSGLSTATGEVTKNISLKNNGIYTNVQSFDASVTTNVANVFLYDQNQPVSTYSKISSSNYQGLSVLGNFTMSSDGLAFVSKYSGNVEGGKKVFDDKKTPYVFVTGEINWGNCSVAIGTFNDGTTQKDKLDTEYIGNKVNVYCGNFICGDQLKNVNASSDIYCYNDIKTSVFGGQNGSHLTNWVAALKGDLTKNSNTIQGSIYSKGSVKLKGTGLFVDGSIFIDKDLDLSEVTGGDVPEVSGSVYLKGNLISGTSSDAKYTNLVNKIYTYLNVTHDGATDTLCVPYSKFVEVGNHSISVTTEEYNTAYGSYEKWNHNFPASKELSQILGVKFDSSAVSGSEQLTAVNKGEYTVDDLETTNDKGEVLKLANKIIQVPKETKLRYYNDEGKLIGSKDKSGVPDGAPVITKINSTIYKDGIAVQVNDGAKAENIYIDKDSGELVIKQSCTISGMISGSNIRIIPGSKAPLWINLDSVHFQNGKILAEDGENVYFYIEEGKNLVVEGTKIVTEYYDEYFGSDKKLVKDLSLSSIPSDTKEIPNIYIFSNNDETRDTSEHIVFRNNPLFTGYIIAPKAKFSTSDAGGAMDKGVSFTYNGDDCTNDNIKIGTIGSIIVGEISETDENGSPCVANNFTLVYVDGTGKTGSAPEISFGYKPIPGFSNY